MKVLRPGIISVRAINQYRRRDVMAYLGLRYYLENVAARSDDWAKNVATNLILTRTNLPYFHAFHFKETNNKGAIDHRELFIPGANEALAETALLYECSKYDEFSNPPGVFSYHLNSGDSRSGIFKPYIKGLRDRQLSIAKACEACPEGQVVYTDIKGFYPSIKENIAIDAWRKRSERAGLQSLHFELGKKLIADHNKARNHGENGILTGPMFSHLIGNLVLREIDEKLSKILPVKYFRYVDDITLVGDSRAIIEESLGILKDHLNDIGLELYGEASHKFIQVSSDEWLKSQDDFRDDLISKQWMKLISELKRFLLMNPEKYENVQNAFRDEGLRIPVLDYRAAVYERSFLKSIFDLSKKPWFRLKSRGISIRSLLDDAILLRKKCEKEFRSLADNASKTTPGFNRKRYIPKLRLQAGRLIYIANDDELKSLYGITKELPELIFHAQVMETVATGNIDKILSMGVNVAQAAAQPLRAARKDCITSLVNFSDTEKQALAIFILNGVPVNLSNDSIAKQSDIVRFALLGSDVKLTKNNAEPFLREIACLHGITDEPRHPKLLESAFDKDEDLAMDAIDQLQQSSSL